MLTREQAIDLAVRRVLDGPLALWSRLHAAGRRLRRKDIAPLAFHRLDQIRDEFTRIASGHA
jgi:hypothetical protein